MTWGASENPAIKRRLTNHTVFEAASREIADEEVTRLPADGSLQHDYYIYGMPRRPV
jgi:hypothetical protein